MAHLFYHSISTSSIAQKLTFYWKSYISRQVYADAILLKNLLGAETARMNKKGALEAMRTETTTTKAPSTWSQAVTKFENGKNRLLLSAELALYIVQNMFLSVIGRVYNKDSRYEAP